MMNWFYKRLLEKGCVWTDGIHRITAELREQSITIRFYPRRESQGNVYINLSIQPRWKNGWRVRIDDLCQIGGADVPWNRGVGTLLMNLAIQCIHLRFAEAPESVVIEGEAVPSTGDTADSSSKIRERNYTFWGRFGLKIDDPSADRSPMSCPLSELNLVKKGDVFGGVPSSLSIKGFLVQANEDFCLKGDFKAVGEAAISPLTLRLPTKKQIADINARADKQENKAIAVSAFSLLIAPLLAFGVSPNSLLSCAVLAPLLAVGGIMAKRKAWSRRFCQASVELEREQQSIGYKIEDIKDRLSPLTEKNPTALHRLASRYRTAVPSLASHHLSAAEKFATGSDLSDDEVVAAGQTADMLSKFKKPKRETCEDQHSDFIFGPHCRSMYENDLAQWANVLGDRYSFHLERLLSNIGVMKIFGNTDTQFGKILSSAVDHVGYIEFLREGESEYTDLSAKVYLNQGILHFDGIWTAYRNSRAKEIAHALQSLEDLGLLERTYIRWDGRKLTSIGKTSIEAMKDLLVLIDEPHYREEDINKWCGAAEMNNV